MPQKNTGQNAIAGSKETLVISLLSELFINAATGILKQEQINQVTAKMEDMIVVGLPDTGKALFKPSKPYVKKKGKDGQPDEMADSKAVFIVAEHGNSYQGQPLNGYQQSVGDHAGLDLIAEINIIALPPNTAGKTLDECFNRKPQLTEVPKTGTDN